MPDCMAAEIWIGGTIQAADVTGLYEAMGAEHAAIEWGEGAFAPGSADELLAARTSFGDTRLLYLCDSDAPYGQFEHLESFLKEHGIPFDRRSDGKYEYDPLFVQFRPGLEYSEQLTDHDGNPTVHSAPLYEVAKMLGTALSGAHQNDWPAAQTALEAAYARLNEHLPPAMSPLPTFEIAGDLA